MVLTCRDHGCGADLYFIVPSPWYTFMGISSTSCSRSYMIWPVPTSSSYPILNFVLHAKARKASFDLILSIYLLQRPLTFSFLHLDCYFSKICIWLSSHYSDVSWNVISSKRPSLTMRKFLLSFHYFTYHNAINVLLRGIIFCHIDLFHCIFIICLFPGMWSNGSGLKVLLPMVFSIPRRSFGTE